MGLRLPLAAAKGRAKLLPDNNTYEINGRTYRVEDTGTEKGDLSKSQQLQRDPKFVNNPDKVAR
ncbi:hypothetical protein [Streptomyces coeruleorubidus]|uniref:hypothetical protein n=1 Tax=Streptomyces coeruleorubidus TaxID=116188 RepID=UPI0036696180